MDRVRHLDMGILSMMIHRPTLIIFLILVIWLNISPATAQTEGGQIGISDVDGVGFPEIVFNLLALGPDNRVVTDLAPLILHEDERLIGEYSAEPIDLGSELIIVVDADTSIEDRDEAEGLTRRENVRDSIVRYANHFMDPQQLDRVTIIVPEGEGARVLDKEGMSFPNEVINSINFYESGELSEPSLNQMMMMALEQAATTGEEGRSQSILLFTDAGQLEELLELEALSQMAQELEVSIFTAILGARADAAEIENVSRLTDPTGGLFVHMPDPMRTDELYEAIQQKADRFRISYRSSLTSSGSHVLSAELNGSQSEQGFEILVAPPAVNLAVDNSRPIRRATNDIDAPVEEMEPTQQPLVAQVDWPDEHPRVLESAGLLVNGTEMPVDNIILGDDGLLTFDWDIRFLEEGTYDLQVTVIDELGMEGISEPLPLTIEIDRPVIPPTSPPPTEPAPEPVAIPTIKPESLPLNLVFIGGGGLILLFVFIVFALIIGFLLVRGRRRQAGEVPVEPADPSLTEAYRQPMPPPGPAATGDLGYTYVMPPEFADGHQPGAFLQVLENAPDHTGLIPISGNNVALGRDAKQAQVAFSDRSVSRLHARIMENRGVYRIYDEGSASGTYVNYERIGLTPSTLSDKDHIHLGRVHLQFHLASSMQEPPTSDSDTQVFDPY